MPGIAKHGATCVFPDDSHDSTNADAVTGLSHNNTANSQEQAFGLPTIDCASSDCDSGLNAVRLPTACAAHFSHAVA